MSIDAAAEKHFRDLERMYHASPINGVIPSRLKVWEGGAETHTRVGREYWHSAHSMHGSMYFKGLDDAAFFAANSVVREFFVLTARFEIELLAIVTCEALRSVGFLERREGKKVWARAELYDDREQLVARGSGLFVVGRVALTEATGYSSSPEGEPGAGGSSEDEMSS